MEEKTAKHKKHKRIFTITHQQKIILVCTVIFLAFVFLFFRISSHGFLFWNNNSKSSLNLQKSNVTLKRDPLTGVFGENIESFKQIFAVMTDEHIDSRPLSGLDQAFLVFEAPVESGIPRLLAFFSVNQSVDKIGPIRSARPYFIDWANELDALYVHVGGSNEALDKIANGITFDLNEFWQGNFFWRDRHRYAPFNVYTSTDLLKKYVQQKKDAGRRSNPIYGFWQFKDSEKINEINNQSFSIEYAFPSYVSEWRFDKDKKRYVRFQDNQDLFVDNVVVVITDVKVIDGVGRRKIRTIGSGTAVVFQDGREIEARWKKPSLTERLRFFDSTGEEIKMNAGITWVEVVGDISQLKK